MDDAFLGEALAYLLEEMGAGERQAFEARLAREPAAADAVKALANALAAEALERPGTAVWGANERGQTAVRVVAAATMARAARSESASSLARFAWPLAAAILLLLNLAQWRWSRATPAAASPAAEAALRNPMAQTVAYSEPVSGRIPVVVPAIVINWSQTILIKGAAGGPQPPFAKAAFDASRRQGFLDLHNLPALPADRALQLWVRRLGASRYEAVGQIPSQLYGHSGSVTYRVPSLAVAPNEILITEEPRGGLAAEPRGAVVLHGP